MEKIDIDDAVIFVQKPANIAELPAIDKDSINEKYFTIETKDSVAGYFNDILEGNIRICLINGVRVEYSEWASYNCDYCRAEITGEYYYCYHCNKDMCMLCYEEVNEAIAILHGAKKYHERRDALDACREASRMGKRNTEMCRENDRLCDLCSELIGENINFYSTFEDGKCFDICSDCYANDKQNARNTVEQKKMALYDTESILSYLFGQTDFESMMYWFPVLTDTESCRVLVNLNVDSKNYNKVCLQSSDDHGRCGYYVVNLELEDIIQRLKDITDTVPDLCTTHHSSPIHRLMEELKIQIYYG